VDHAVAEAMRCGMSGGKDCEEANRAAAATRNEKD
jgi:hypothetical protein